MATIPDLTFCHLISGQDYPLKSNAYFDDFFETNSDKSFISYDSTDTYWESNFDIYHLNNILNLRQTSHYYINSLFVRLQRMLQRFGIKVRRDLPMKIYKGTNWWSLNRTTVEYILRFVDENKWYVNRFKHTHCCDELFFQMILYNAHDPKIRSMLVNENLRYVDWQDRGAPLPNVLDERDWNNIKQSSALFCRKVNIDKSARLMDMIDGKIEII